MSPVRKRGVRAFVAAAGIGALMLVGAPSAQATDGDQVWTMFTGTSQVSWGDAHDIAYASANESGFPRCDFYSSRTYGSPVTYEVDIVCWTS